MRLSSFFGRVTRRGFALSIACACLAWRPAGLHADGAFADSQAILLPRMRPHRIIASTDLPGLVVSDDDGASWSYLCEAAIGHFAGLFQLGPEPAETLFAITQSGLSISEDAGCSWPHVGDVARRAGDVFPDRLDAERVLLVAQVEPGPGAPSFSDVVAESLDGGRSFRAAMYQTATASISGVEVARSDPNAIYLTMTSFQAQHPFLVRSVDGGGSWAELDLSDQLGHKPLVLRILAVDPEDAGTLFLRLSDGTRDALAITHDAGTTTAVALSLDTRMTAFLQRSDGALIVAGADARSFISYDGGTSFEPWSDAFQIQALAERDGVLYATANSRRDGFAIAASQDAGEHWQPLLRLERLQGVMTCGSLPADCAAIWSQLRPSLPALSGPALAADSDRTQQAGCSVGKGASDGWLWLFGCVALSGRRSRFGIHGGDA